MGELEPPKLLLLEGDKKSLIAAASTSTGGGAAAAGTQDAKWRKNFSFKKKFDAKSNENVEEFLRDLDFALTEAQVHNEEQKLHTLLDALGEVTSSDYVLKSEQLKKSCRYIVRSPRMAMNECMGRSMM
eukprot:SAG11_NODE_12853_length_682_cov_1.147513_1_plen_129_part_00